MRLAAVVILFNPEDKVIDNILTYSNAVEILYIIDNSENPLPNIAAILKKIDRSVYLSDFENEGLAKRLNDAAAKAKHAGFDWLLTMDQDSFFPDQSFQHYKSCLEGYNNKSQIALFGPQHEYSDLQSPFCTGKNVTHIITSGSIMNLNLYEPIGRFDEDLFIDQVDLEYCYRAILNGYALIQFENIFLRHSLGHSSAHRSLKSLKKTSRSLHSPLRLYYMTRNFLFIRARYKKHFPKEIAISQKDLLIRYKNNILYNDHKVKTIKYILLGLLHFLINKKGKLK